MKRIAMGCCLILCAGCSGESGSDGANPGSGSGVVEDGGKVESADRDKAEAYFAALGRVRSAKEEEQVLSEFGEWLRASGYRIRSEVKKGKHVLSCPYFPPVTPWTEHSFLDPGNLELLPLLEESSRVEE